MNFTAKTLTGIAFLLVVSVDNLVSQTRFLLPDTTVDYSSYKYVDECLAATNRLNVIAESAEPIWADTMHTDTLKLLRPYPSHVISAAQYCLKDLDPDTVSRKDFVNVSRLLLIAKRDDDVERLIERLVSAAQYDSVKTNIYMSAFNIYLSSQPARIPKVKSLYKLIVADSTNQLSVWNVFLKLSLARTAEMSGESAIGDSIAREFLIIAKNSPQRLKDIPYHGMVKDYIYPFVVSRALQESMDSLKKSTEAYSNYLNGIWTLLMGDETVPLASPIGLTAPQPIGDFFFESKNNGKPQSKTEQLPQIAQGTANLVYFIQSGCHSRASGNPQGRSNGISNICWSEIARIRRYKKQYPRLNIILVTSTYGVLGTGPALSPTVEADKLAEYFLEFHGIEGALVVEETEFFRVTGYDRRRIDLDGKNTGAYKFDGKHAAINPLGNIFLIDEIGKIFFVGSLAKQERLAYESFRTVMSRGKHTLSAEPGAFRYNQGR